jgi:hypothetical protein
VPRRPLSTDDREVRVRVFAFVVALIVIVAIVIGAVVVFGSFLTRFGEA